MKLARFLPYRLSVLSNRVSTLIASAYSERFDLGIPEWRVVAVIGETSGLTATQVSEQTAMDKVAVTRAVKLLVAKGLMRRFASQRDGRVAHLKLTAKGRKVYAEIAPLAESYERRIFGELSGAERSALHALIDRLSARLSELEQAAETASADLQPGD